MYLFKRTVLDNVKCSLLYSYTVFSIYMISFGASAPIETFSNVVAKGDITKNLTSNNISQTTDTEVKDLTKTTAYVTTPIPMSDKNIVVTPTSVPINDTKTVVTILPLPTNGSKTEGNNTNNSDKYNLHTDIISSSESKSSNKKHFNTTAATVAAISCSVLAVASYVGILLWKNVIQRRYQNREILLNEDDLGDINDEDMRHFEAACIQIQA